MEKRAFFGENGLTQTSANYICNKAKEFYQDVETKMANIKFYNTELSIIGGERSKTISKGSTVGSLNVIPEMIKDIYEAKALIAFLREAIKEKAALYTKCQDYVSDELKNHYTKCPQLEAYLTKEDIINSWSIKELEHYINLETECAVLGSIIHPNGSLNRARKDLINKMVNPTDVAASGRDTLIYDYIPLVSIESVDKTFFNLQEKHREKQAELNGILHKIEVTIKNDTLAKDTAYHNAKKAYDDEYLQLLRASNLKKQELCKEVDALKIVIPNNLKDIYNKISNL